jgi:hypothetical protein
MLSKKVFLAGELNFSAPPVHAARADVRDHVESQEGDHRASYASDRRLQKRRQANTIFREIWRASIFDFFDSIGQAETIQQVSRHGSSLQNLTHAAQQPASLFDHLVGAKQELRDFSQGDMTGGFYFLVRLD